MRTLLISLQDITGVPAADGDVVWVSSPVRRPAGQSTLTPKEHPVDLVAGEGSVEVHPGPLHVRFDLAGVTFREGPTARVVVPEGEGEVTLTELLSEAADWTPQELSEFAQLRQAAAAAAEEAAETAQQTDLLRIATALIAAQAAGDRAAIEELRAELVEAAEQNAAPHLTTTALNATYGTKAEVATKADANDFRLGAGASLLSTLAQPTLGVTLERISAGQYYLFSNLLGQRRIRWTLQETSNSRPGVVHQIRDVHAITVEDNGGVTTTVVDERDNPDITWSGTWATAGSGTPIEGAHGGSVRRTTTPGSYAEWTSPAASAVGILGVQTVQGGIAKVTVDGSAEKANLLPTAQDLIASGVLNASALVANGGTLNPTDRLIDYYTHLPTVYSWDVPIASGLDEAPHTVRVTATEYRDPAAIDQRIQIDAFTYGVNASGTVTVEKQLGGTGSVWEYAIRAIVGGSGDIIGNDHGHEYQTGIEFLVDGEMADLADGESVSGSEIVVLRTSQLTHPGVGLTPGDAGEAVCEWRLKGDAMSVTYAFTPAFNSVEPNNKMGGPLPSVYTATSKGFTRGRTLAMDSDRHLDAHDGTLHPSDPESPNGNGLPADTTLFWQPEGHWALITHVPDAQRTYRDRWVTVYLQDRAAVADRPDLNLAKAYFRQMAVPFEAGKTIRGQGIHRFVWLPNPDLTLGM